MYHWRRDAASVSRLGIAGVVHTPMIIKEQNGRKRQNDRRTRHVVVRDELNNREREISLWLLRRVFLACCEYEETRLLELSITYHPSSLRISFRSTYCSPPTASAPSLPLLLPHACCALAPPSPSAREKHVGLPHLAVCLFAEVPASDAWPPSLCVPHTFRSSPPMSPPLAVSDGSAHKLAAATKKVGAPFPNTEPYLLPPPAQDATHH